MNKGILIAAILSVAFFIGCQNHQKKENKAAENTELKTVEKEWVSLFDGKTLTGWHNYGNTTISDEWQITNGELIYTPDPNKNHGLNNLVTDKEYTNFVLSLDWKISEGGNSGFFWGIFEDKKYAVPYLTAPEIQILDNEGHPDGKNKTHTAGSLWDMIAPSEKVAKPVGEWNTCVLEINYKSNSGKVWLNGLQIVVFPVSGPEWENMIQNSKFKDWEGFGTYKTGRIGLQDHGSGVAFRNIKIKELD